MSKILITGGIGFIGTHLTSHLKRQHELVLLSWRRPDVFLGNSIERFRVDLSEPVDFSKLPSKIDVFIHLAQSNFYRQFTDKAEDFSK